MSKEAMKLALDALEKLVRFESDSWELGSCRIAGQATKALREALAEQPAPVQQEPKKLKVTLEDRPIDIELAQYKRMFEAACSALGSIGDALGVDPEEGGAEPILAAISELKTCSTCEALARAVMMDQTSHDRFPPVEENT